MLVVPPLVMSGAMASLVRIGAAVFIVFGAIPLAWTIRNAVWPTYVRCASADARAGVPTEPVVDEGAIFWGHLTHELSEDAAGWSFCPARRRARAQKVALISFGVPFLVGFAGLLTWVFHQQFRLGGWALSAGLATIATSVCGGTPMLVLAALLRTANQRLCTLTIPRGGTDLELESPSRPQIVRGDLANAADWFFSTDSTRSLKIPRQSVLAVQLCPWILRTLSEQFAAVQGLLVIASPDQAGIQRIPLLLSGDMIGAARLMEKLAAILAVPYLFHGDAEGWNAERLRANTRPELRTGGFMS